MPFLKKYGFYILAAIITIVGIVTGWYLFIFLIFPLGWFNFGKNNRNK
ncbi:MAG TPA: hypothetical protein VFI78_02260 [Salinimicrobium sp.]|nr:hypothetical protein [Salinimicrobium sp.]